MDVKQKERVAHMRLAGWGYSKIAQALGISKNTIKSYCKRNRLSGRQESPEDRLVCKNCGREIKQTPGRKTRKFCSDKCRVDWWNAHPELVNRGAIYHMYCVHCGGSFESYGNKSRKFCSQACYISSRFGLREESKA